MHMYMFKKIVIKNIWMMLGAIIFYSHAVHAMQNKQKREFRCRVTCNSSCEANLETFTKQMIAGSRHQPGKSDQQHIKRMRDLDIHKEKSKPELKRRDGTIVV